MTYHNLIIILVTSGEGVTTRNSAYSAHADDILFKPFDKVLLQKRILSLEARQTSSVETANVQDEIGLFNQASLMTTLHEILRKSSRTKEYLVLFEIHHFDVFVQQQGNVVARRQLVSISNQLQWEMDLKMQCFTYNSSVFAVVFDESNVDVIENRMNKFLTSLVQDEKKYHFSFDCSIVPISKEFGGVQQILQTAEHGLREASKKSPAPVQTIILLPKGESIAKRELLIVDSDRELLKMLKQAFEFHGIVVNTYAEGSEALKMLLSCTENRLPSLIIVERKLPDMDGMDIYLKLKERFKVDVPFYILTLFSSDKDVSEGIEQGILEYIVKPFNISLLVQKVLKAIS